MGVHSFRLTEEQEARLRALGISPGAKAKELLQEELWRGQVRADLAWLERHAVKADRPAAALVREMREE